MAETFNDDKPSTAQPNSRRLALGIGGAVVVLVVAAIWLLSDDAPQETAETPQAALDNAPTLQELAEQAPTPAGDDAAPDFSVAPPPPEPTGATARRAARTRVRWC